MEAFATIRELESDGAQIAPQEGSPSMKLASNTGMLLLGIWLVLYGLTPLLHLDFQALPLLMNVLAVAAGAMILMNK
jgi:hypothetical protein